MTTEILSGGEVVGESGDRIFHNPGKRKIHFYRPS